MANETKNQEFNKSIKQFVYVVDKKYDFVYGGWLEYYSFDPDNKELYLSDVVVTKDSNRCEELRRFEKLYITYDNQNMCIEINGGKEDNDGSKKW